MHKHSLLMHGRSCSHSLLFMQNLSEFCSAKRGKIPSRVKSQKTKALNFTISLAPKLLNYVKHTIDACMQSMCKVNEEFAQHKRR